MAPGSSRFSRSAWRRIERAGLRAFVYGLVVLLGLLWLGLAIIAVDAAWGVIGLAEF